MLAFFLIVELATLSRSGLLGLGAGLLVLALPYRRRLASRDLLVPLAASLALVGIVVLSRLSFFETVIRSRVSGKDSSASVHFGVYDFIPHVLSAHPLFGLGFNNFSVYYELVTGKSNWGPHSFYVALLVETGLVGAVVFPSSSGISSAACTRRARWDAPLPSPAIPRPPACARWPGV